MYFGSLNLGYLEISKLWHAHCLLRVLEEHKHCHLVTWRKGPRLGLIITSAHMPGPKEIRGELKETQKVNTTRKGDFILSLLLSICSCLSGHVSLVAAKCRWPSLLIIRDTNKEGKKPGFKSRKSYSSVYKEPVKIFSGWMYWPGSLQIGICIASSSVVPLPFKFFLGTKNPHNH